MRICNLLDAALVNCQNEQEHEATISFARNGSYKMLPDWINQR